MPTKKEVKKSSVKKKPAKKVVKKVSKKATAKKATKKTAKKISKKSTTKPLVYAGDSTSFWVSDGRILNSLIALRDALAEMDTQVYTYHAAGDNNDFANWVEVVLCDGNCAHDLRKAKTPASAKTIVVRHLKYYTS